MTSHEDDLFFDMNKDLLKRLGYDIHFDHESSYADLGEIQICATFKENKRFLPLKYAPAGTTIFLCQNKSHDVINSLNELKKQVEGLNKNLSFTDYLKSKNLEKVTGSLLISRIDKTTIDVEYDEQDSSYFWGMHRIFFYTMKISTHSWLEDWVKDSNLGFVLKEDEMKIKLEKPFYGTVITGLRFEQQTNKLHITLSYFIDCIKNPHEVSRQIYTLDQDHIHKILDDVYTRLTNSIIQKLYPDQKMNITIEIHSISGIDETVERETKDFAPTYKDWSSINVEQINMDEHTLFKYSVIPWEAVMDVAYTKKNNAITNYRFAARWVVVF